MNTKKKIEKKKLKIVCSIKNMATATATDPHSQA